MILLSISFAWEAGLLLSCRWKLLAPGMLADTGFNPFINLFLQMATLCCVSKLTGATESSRYNASEYTKKGHFLNELSSA